MSLLARRSTWMAFAAVMAVLLGAVYLVALGTHAGRDVDEAGILKYGESASLPRVQEATEAIVTTIDRGSLLFFGLAALGLALVRRRGRLAVAIVILLVGANLGTQVLKPLLGNLDPTGGDALRFPHHDAFPSGHATVSMSLALSLLLGAPHRWRPVVAAAGAGYAALVGGGMVALGWHFPSDVAGGYLMAAAWTAIAVALVGPGALIESDGGRPLSGMRWGLGLAGGILLVGGLAVGAGLIATRPELVDYGRLHTTFFVGAGALGIFAAVVAGAVSTALGQAAVPASRPGPS
ncbi:MAG: phosphatase PAP2 family protein [Solirubrobacterales bacterium]